MLACTAAAATGFELIAELSHDDWVESEHESDNNALDEVEAALEPEERDDVLLRGEYMVR